MKHFYILFPGILLSCVLFGQSRKGQVYDADTREPLAGATIRAGTLSFQSGVDGSFSFPPGESRVEVSFSGYVTQEAGIDHPGIGLRKNTDQMQEVVVSADRTAEKERKRPLRLQR